MKSALLLLSPLVLQVMAAPSPQNMDFGALIQAGGTLAASAAPLTASTSAATVTFNVASATSAAASATITDVGTTTSTATDSPNGSSKRSSIVKRDGTCAPQTQGAYTQNPSSTDSDFLSNNTLHALARGSPSVLAEPFVAYGIAGQGGSGPFIWKDLEAAANAPGYLGYTTLTSYNPYACLEYCENQASQATANKCTAFNIYIERDPLLDPSRLPAPGYPAGCPNPPPTGNVKCSIYSNPLTTASATNAGQYRDDFHVVITASNAYNKQFGSLVPSPVSDSSRNFAKPTSLQAAINAPFEVLYNTQKSIDTYIGTTWFVDGVFSPDKCAIRCDDLTAAEKAAHNGGEKV